MYLETGGPASGKSYTFGILKEEDYSKYLNSVKINPDHYKPLLLDVDTLAEEEKKYNADYSHLESSLIGKIILNKWFERSKNGQYTNLIADICVPSDKYILKAKELNIKIRNDIMTVNTLEALKRANIRGDEEPERRYVPRKILLKLHKEQTSSFINNIVKHNDFNIKIYSNNFQKGEIPLKSTIKIANSKEIEIYDLKSAVEFWNKQYINIEAINEEELQNHEDRYDKAIMGFAKETEKEVYIYDKDGKTIIAKSNRNNIEILNQKKFDLIIENAGYEKDTNIREQTNIKPIIINQNIPTQNLENRGRDISDELFGPHANEINPTAISESNSNLELSKLNMRILKTLKITQLLNSLKQSKLIKENSRHQKQQQNNSNNSKNTPNQR